MNDQLLGLIRMGLVFFGGIIVQAGWLGQADWDLVVGSLVSLIGVGWSVWTKINTVRVPTDTLTQKQVNITGVEPPSK